MTQMREQSGDTLDMCNRGVCEVGVLMWSGLTALSVGSTLLPHGRAGYKQLSDPPEPETEPASAACLMSWA